MNNPLMVLKAQQIVNEILTLAYNSVNVDFDKLILRAEIEKGDGYVGTSLELLKNDVRVDTSDEGGDFSDHNLIEDLYDIMKDENGKSWTSFVLTYENGGQANIKYDYSPLPEE